MAQLVAIPEGGDRPIPLRCAANGVLLVQPTGAAAPGLDARLNSTDVPPPVPPPPNPILGINPAGELQAVAVDDYGRLMIHDVEGQKSLRDSVKKIKGLANTPATPRFYNLGICGEVRTVILRPNHTEPSSITFGPAVLIHISSRNNIRSTALLKIRFRTTSAEGEAVTDSFRSIDRELGPCESFDMPFAAGIAIQPGTMLEAIAVAEKDANKNVCYLPNVFGGEVSGLSFDDWRRQDSNMLPDDSGTLSCAARVKSTLDLAGVR